MPSHPNHYQYPLLIQNKQGMIIPEMHFLIRLSILCEDVSIKSNIST